MRSHLPFGTRPDPDFAMVRPEIDRLKILTQTPGNRVLLEGPRRIGKTLLVKQAVPQDKLLIADLRGIRSRDQLMASLLRACEDYSGQRPALRQRKGHSEGAGLSFQLRYLRETREETEHELTLEDLFEHIQSLKVRGTKAHPLVVFIDEVQELLACDDGIALAGRIRSLTQHQDDLTYVFAGSDSRLLSELADGAQTPFYKQLQRIPVGPLPQAGFVAWIRQRLEPFRLSISDDAISLVFRFAREIPGDIQRVLLEAFLRAASIDQSREIQADQIEAAIAETLANTEPQLSTINASLTSTQRHLALALSALLHQGWKAPPTGKNMQRISGLETSGTLRSALHSLQKRGIVTLWRKRYQVDDPFLEAWLIDHYAETYEPMVETIRKLKSA